jgi:hypothetical protein
VLVSLVSLAIAASLAEICSVFPTSGGVYCESRAAKSEAKLSLIGLNSNRLVGYAFDSEV